MTKYSLIELRNQPEIKRVVIPIIITSFIEIIFIFTLYLVIREVETNWNFMGAILVLLPIIYFFLSQLIKLINILAAPYSKVVFKSEGILIEKKKKPSIFFPNTDIRSIHLTYRWIPRPYIEISINNIFSQFRRSIPSKSSKKCYLKIVIKSKTKRKRKIYCSGSEYDFEYTEKKYPQLCHILSQNNAIDFQTEFDFKEKVKEYSENGQSFLQMSLGPKNVPSVPVIFLFIIVFSLCDFVFIYHFVEKIYLVFLNFSSDTILQIIGIGAAMGIFLWGTYKMYFTYKIRNLYGIFSKAGIQFFDSKKKSHFLFLSSENIKLLKISTPPQNADDIPSKFHYLSLKITLHKGIAMRFHYFFSSPTSGNLYRIAGIIESFAVNVMNILQVKNKLNEHVKIENSSELIPQPKPNFYSAR